jgi:hypothetical protein
VKYESRKAPSKSAINRLVNNSEALGSVIDNKKGVVSKKKSVRTPDVGCRWSWMPTVLILKMFLCDCQSPKTTELTDTKYSDVCYVFG